MYVALLRLALPELIVLERSPDCLLRTAAVELVQVERMIESKLLKSVMVADKLVLIG